MNLAIDIESSTKQNTAYRLVVTTTKQAQLVLMSLLPGQEIGLESHSGITQFIRIEEGQGIGLIGTKPYALKDGVSLMIPADTPHNVTNTSAKNSLKLYTIYSFTDKPPHKDGEIQLTKPLHED